MVAYNVPIRHAGDPLIEEADRPTSKTFDEIVAKAMAVAL